MNCDWRTLYLNHFISSFNKLSRIVLNEKQVCVNSSIFSILNFISSESSNSSTNHYGNTASTGITDLGLSAELFIFVCVFYLSFIF